MAATFVTTLPQRQLQMIYGSVVVSVFVAPVANFYTGTVVVTADVGFGFIASRAVREVMRRTADLSIVESCDDTDDDDDTDQDSNEWQYNRRMTESACIRPVWHRFAARHHCTVSAYHIMVILCTGLLVSLWCISHVIVFGLQLSLLLTTMVIRHTHVKLEPCPL